MEKFLGDVMLHCIGDCYYIRKIQYRYRQNRDSLMYIYNIYTSYIKYIDLSSFRRCDSLSVTVACIQFFCVVIRLFKITIYNVYGIPLYYIYLYRKRIYIIYYYRYSKIAEQRWTTIYRYDCVSILYMYMNGRHSIYLFIFCLFVASLP